MSTPPFNAVPLPDNSDTQGNPHAGNTPPIVPDQAGGVLGILKGGLSGLWQLINMNRNMQIGSWIVFVFVLLALFGPLLAQHDPNRLTEEILQPPSSEHWLGTTQAGQDVFAQLMVGTRYSIFWGFVTAIMVTFIYVAVGLCAGYFGGAIDELMTLVTNVFLVIPGFPLALIMAAYIPYKGPLTVAIVIAITGWAGHARIIRAQTLTMRNRDFVEAARVSGLPTWSIIFAEILPNMLAIVGAGFVGTMLSVVLAAAGLEFLGLGDIRSISWGSMFYWAQNGSALLQGAWWWFIPPGACVALLGAGLTFINIGIDEIADPRLRSEKRRFKLRREQKESTLQTITENKEQRKDVHE